MSLAVKKYVNSLMEIAVEEKCMDEIYEQFKAVSEELTNNQSFVDFLNMDMVSSTDKKALFEAVLKGGNKYLLNFLKLIVDKSHTEELKEMFYEFEDQYKAQKNILEALAVTAIELTDEDIEGIKDMLTKKYNKTIVLTTQVDPSILGGMKLYVGNVMLDASVSSKLNGLKNALKQIKIS